MSYLRSDGKLMEDNVHYRGDDCPPDGHVKELAGIELGKILARSLGACLPHRVIGCTCESKPPTPAARASAGEG